MRKLILILPALACYLFIHAQNKINSYEYWFDNNYAQKVQTNISSVSAFTLNQNIAAASLSNGLHTYNVRFRDDSLRYSAVTSQFFIKLPASVFANKQVTAYEYWFDDNYANKVSLFVGPESSYQLNTNLNIASLSNGLRSFKIRFKDDSGLWSAVTSQFIVKLPASFAPGKQIVEYEYWFDNNHAGRITEAITAESSYQLVTYFNTSSLSNGLHNINIRFKDNAGLWSPAVSQFIIKLPPSVSANKQIVAYEYWFDKAYEQKILQTVALQNQFQITTDIATSMLSNGLHNVNIRFKDNSGLWSSTVSQFIIKLPPSVSANKQIVEYEYWFDIDYVQKISQQVSRQSLLQLDTGLNTASINPGLHSFKIRFKDNSGLWSSTISQFVYKRSNATSDTNMITDYRYWFDMNDSTMVNVNLRFPTNPYLLVTKINTTALDTGFHSVQFQFKDTNGLWSLPTIDTFYQVGEPSLVSIFPNSGGNTGDVTVNITGNGFFPGTSVKLTRAGYADIIVSDSLTLIDKFGINIRGTFDLHSVDTGYWNVVVTIPNDTVMSLVNGFRVDSGVIIKPIVSIIGFNSIRLNQWQTYTVVCSNPGNVDAKGVPLWLAVPHDAQVEFDFKFYPLRDSLINFDTIPKFVTVDTVQFQPFNADVYPFFVPNIEANNMVAVSFKMKVTSGANYMIKSWANPPAYGNGSFLKYAVGDCWEGVIGTVVDIIPGGGCIYGLLDLGFSPYFDLYHNGLEYFDNKYLGSLAWNFTQTTLDCAIPGATGTAKTAMELISKGMTIAEFPYGACLDNLNSVSLNEINVNTVNSFDPNEKLGPIGFGESNYFNANVPYPYVIHFENVDSATASAQTVAIRDTIDQNVFDVNTIELGFIKIGDSVFQIQAGRKSLDDYLDLRPKQNIILKATAGYNDTTGVLSWEFIALDPLTYEQVLDPSIGFLPPNVTAPEGEGSVFYTIRLKDSLAYNTSISNKACIYFDNNPAICTNNWINTVDNIKPESKIDSLASPIRGLYFTVNWAGSDTGAGIKNYSVFYSVNGGEYKVWLANTSATSAEFTGIIDSVYGFYSVALDSAGNIERSPQLPDAITVLRSDFTWRGTISTDWRQSSNWSGGAVPGINDEVVIPANTPFIATVPPGLTVWCKSILVLPGAVIIIGENGHLKIDQE